jgi:hypothetical protein
MSTVEGFAAATGDSSPSFIAGRCAKLAKKKKLKSNF